MILVWTVVSCSVTYAKHLIRWCLQGDPSNRPSFETILKHPFIRSLDNVKEDESIKTEEKTSRPSISEEFETISSLPSQDMRYHFFISHMQAEASGDVGTMYHLFANMGINCWYVFMLIECIAILTHSSIHTGAT